MSNNTESKTMVATTGDAVKNRVLSLFVTWPGRPINKDMSIKYSDLVVDQITRLNKDGDLSEYKAEAGDKFLIIKTFVNFVSMALYIAVGVMTSIGIQWWARQVQNGRLGKLLILLAPF